MKFRSGDIVINPAMPQWGRGEVLDVSVEYVLVKFPRYGIRKIVPSFLALADTGECPEPTPPASARLVQPSQGRPSRPSLYRALQPVPGQTSPLRPETPRRDRPGSPATPDADARARRFGQSARAPEARPEQDGRTGIRPGSRAGNEGRPAPQQTDAARPAGQDASRHASPTKDSTDSGKPSGLVAEALAMMAEREGRARDGYAPHQEGRADTPGRRADDRAGGSASAAGSHAASGRSASPHSDRLRRNMSQGEEPRAAHEGGRSASPHSDPHSDRRAASPHAGRPGAANPDDFSDALPTDADFSPADFSPADLFPDDPTLELAERAADLEADARTKARQDAERLRHAAILRFWRDAEVFLIPEVPRSSRPPVTRARRWETVSASLPAWDAARDGGGDDIEAALFAPADGGPLPWTLPLPAGFAAAWHIVYLGVLPRQRISDIILEKTGSEPERPEEPGLGEGCLAAVVLDSVGMPLEASYVPASFVPGLARCLAGKSLDQLPMDMLKMQSEFDRRADAKDEAFLGPWIKDEVERLFEMIALEGEEARIVVRSVYFRPDPKGRRIDDVQNDLLNSFYLNDLDRLLSLSRQGFGGVFARWMDSGTEEARRVDVLSRTEAGRAAMEGALSLDRMPRGRWPFPLAQHLLPAQLAAVTEILGGQLTAVNGPPGTGKTRLLCDVAADLVVQRAWRIAQCRQPHDVFVNSSGEFHVIRKDIMRGTCMVAVSSNNAAVENITRFLPAEESICRADFPDASYFPEVAAAVDAAFAPPDREGAVRPVWGLTSAVLGSAWNCDQFARAFFWGFRDAERGIALPGMKETLDRYRDYEGKQEARSEWHRVKDAFLNTAAALEERREQLASAKDAPKAPEKPDMFAQFLELMAKSKALQAAAGEGDAARELAGRLEGLEEAVKAAQEELAARGAGSKAEPLRSPSREFFSEADWQLKSVWNDEELSRLRTRLFLLALRLHEWTIRSCAREFSTDIGAVTRHLRGAGFGLDDDTDIADIWNVLFFMVPVLSSTLASFSRLFAGMGAASLDWVLMDEAGQATPQSAAGALWRARRAAVIGDPQQIEPVVPQPAALLATLRARQERGGLTLERWSPECQSAQTLADRNAERGTWMDTAGRRVWTGFPLRAHHRCAEPMFSVANRIAYDSQMVQAKKSFARLATPLGSSRWFHVDGHVADTQLVREELACLRRCLLRFQQAWPEVQTASGPREASVFVISPFRKVAWHCRTLAQSMHFPEERVRCGTIHTFQGREADIVFLVLGSSPGSSGWGSRQWASRTPNILNVALTRARSVIYVIGNHRDWRRHPFFDILAEELPVEAQTDDDALTL